MKREHPEHWSRVIHAVKPDVPVNHAMIGPSSRSCDACGARSILSKLTPIAAHPIIKHACTPCVSKLRLKTKELPARWKQVQASSEDKG